FPVRLVGKVTSPEDARVATRWKWTGAERLLGRGDFIAVAEGQLLAGKRCWRVGYASVWLAHSAGAPPAVRQRIRQRRRGIAPERDDKSYRPYASVGLIGRFIEFF
ncbi:hypothetical protein, partial [Thermogutta sp.]|uniref:hypothetical protein n=1 Tax=Thermogutta sp. TaxID=1962930 RepID=UPI00322019FF